ncbi:MAG: hypothetical protein IJK84_04445 [Bacteroidales bacterium]|nr:hypothetical protein [Bacteroidales bacterium]
MASEDTTPTQGTQAPIQPFKAAYNPLQYDGTEQPTHDPSTSPLEGI